MSLNKFTKRLCDKAGVPLFTLHQFRHLGMPMSQLQLFLRHDHQSTTELYAGHLENSTTKQSEYLGFWDEKLIQVVGG